MREALGHRGYVLLTLGFFVCGFQVVFVGVHLPSYLLDKGMPAHLGVTALALIGLFNIVGTYTTGWLGAKIPKRYILSFIYFGRAVVIALFIWLFHGPWLAFKRAVDVEDWPSAGASLNRIRQIIAVNLPLGLLVVVIGGSGRYWG